MIQGYQVPGTTNGDAAVRCVYLGDGAVLSGFTLTNGATRAIGDHYLERSGGGLLCKGYSYLSEMSWATNCVLAGNSAAEYGGGVFGGKLINCTITGNSAHDGGGALSDSLLNCIISGNSASRNGGGATASLLANCAVTGNSALKGGGVYGASFIDNCTITGNSAQEGGGDCRSEFLNGSILYYNTARVRPNYSRDAGTDPVNYCCTTPLPGGTGNTDAEPQLANAFRPSTDSPCRGSGGTLYNPNYETYPFGVDIDGDAWLAPPSIGCDEYCDGSITGA